MMLVRILRTVSLVCVLSGVMAADGALAAAPGDLTQKPGLAGCLSENGDGPCTGATGLQGAFSVVSDTGSGGACADGTGLPFPASVVVSPDGKNVYASADRSEFPRRPRATVFDRAADGTLRNANSTTAGTVGTFTTSTGS